MAREPGQIGESWDDPELQSAIGKFVIQFSQLEYIVRHLLGAMMDLRDPQFDIITGSFDFARLCKVTEAYLLSLTDCDEKLAEHAKTTFAKCLKVNDDRVRIVHGTWLLGPGTSHLSRNSLKMTRHFEKPEEIVAKALEAKALMSDIVEILIGNADERRQFIFKHANDDK
jgi:hypothetical protein